MTASEIRRALIQQGVPIHSVNLIAPIREPAANFLQVVGPQLDFPIRLTLPWSALVSENRRFAAHHSRIVMTVRYKQARARIARIAREAMTVESTQFPALAMPLSLAARVWVPDRRVHDVPNFAGATHNAFKSIIYTDDRWLHDARWSRIDVDCDHPRAEITIQPYRETL